MGINKETLIFLIKSARDCGIGLKGCQMVELGNQRIKEIKLPTGGIAKDYFESLGVNHTSIDINGKDGALGFDLQNKIKDLNLIEKFDILTNFGTTEHIKKQYVCWLNIHNLVRKGGVFVHLLPRIGHWYHHGYHKYSLNFFEDLAENCEYIILSNFIRSNKPGADFVCCAMLKGDREFISMKTFAKIWKQR